MTRLRFRARGAFFSFSSLPMMLSSAKRRAHELTVGRLFQEIIAEKDHELQEPVGEENKSETSNNFIGHKVTVEEVIHTNTYTYLRVNENDEEKWLAISRRETNEGEVLYWTEALEMKNFESKELERTFETIYFIQDISATPTPAAMPSGHAQNMQGRKPTIAKESVSIEKVEGGITISELYANLSEYGGKEIVIKGKITKLK